MYIFNIFIKSDICRNFIGTDMAPNGIRQMFERNLTPVTFFFGIPQGPLN
jgi:hypothetical protein